MNSWQVVGAQSFSTTFGDCATNDTTANNFGLKSTCNYSSSVTVQFYTPSTVNGGKVPPATMQFADGRTFTGKATLGALGTGIAQTGWDMSVSVQWDGSSTSAAAPCRTPWAPATPWAWLRWSTR